MAPICRPCQEIARNTQKLRLADKERNPAQTCGLATVVGRMARAEDIHRRRAQGIGAPPPTVPWPVAAVPLAAALLHSRASTLPLPFRHIPRRRRTTRGCNV